MTAQRRWQFLRSTAGALRTILACLLLTTCGTDSSTAPGAQIDAGLDLSSLLRAPGDLPIPIDEVIVELRRTSDSSLVESPRSIAINPANQSDTALRVSLRVELSRSQEDFYLKVSARGNGVLYFVVESIVTARVGQATQTPPLLPVYVGPGANADDLGVSLLDEDIAAGDSVLVTGSASENDVAVTGVPIGFISSAPGTVRVRQLGLDQAWLIASATAPDAEVTITAVAPNNLSSEFFVNTIGGAPGSLHLVIASQASQAGIVNQLVTSVPTAQVLDQNNAAVPNATVTFSVAGAGGTIVDSVQTTDVEGTAQLGSWRLGTLAGSYTVQAAAPGTVPVSYTAQAGPTTLASLVKISGDAQTAATSTALPQPLVIEARDTFANPLAAGPTVTWTATDGSVVPTSGVLNAQGRTQTIWTLGSTQATPTATATLNGVTTIFTATTTFPNPTIQLSFSGIPGVGIGKTTMARVVLTAAAPAGGVVVNLSNPQNGIATVPGSVTVAAGQTTDSFTVTGVSAGDALVTGSAAGYVSGSLAVNVQLRNLNPPVTINVPYAQTASLPITIPSPAPAGGITVTVISSNPTLVGVATPTVTIAAGGTSASATLQGLLPGQSTITVTNPAYTTGTTTATTAASLNFTPTTLSINGSFGQALDLDFVSNAVAIAAPAPGITVTANILLPTCVAVTPNPATIATGLTTATLSFTYAGTATLPCSSKVVVSAPNIAPDSITVSVAAVPPINASNATIGAGLMAASTVNLGASNHGGVTLSVISLNPSIAQPALGTVVAPADSIGYTVAANNTQSLPTYHGLTPGVATFVAKAIGFVTDTFTVTVAAPGIEIIQLSAATTTFSPNDDFQARIGVPNAGNTTLTSVQAVRFGGTPAVVTLTSGTPTVGRLVTATEPGAGSVQLTIPVGATGTGGSLAAGGIQFDPLTGGTTTVSATAPGYAAVTNASILVTVSSPTITIPVGSVGANLAATIQTGSLSASNHGGTTVWLRSNNPAVMLVSPNTLTQGTDSIAVNMLNGSTQFNYSVHGVGGQTGAIYLVAYAPGFIPDSVLVTVQQPVYDISGLTTIHTNLDPNDAFNVRVGIGSVTGLSNSQVIRPGGTPFVATLTNSNAPVADLVTAALTAQQVTVTIPVGSSLSGAVIDGGVEFDAVAAGTTAVTANIPGLLATNAATTNVTVTATPITLPAVSVAAGLMQNASGSLGGGGQHGGVNVVVKSLNPAVARIAPNATTAPAESLVVSVPNGQVSFAYTIHGMDGVIDSTPLIAYTVGFTPDTAMIRVPQPAIDVAGVTQTQNTTGVNNPFQVRVGIPLAGNGSLSTVQPRRFGAAPLVATIINSNAAIADLVTTGLTADQVTASIAVGQSGTPSTVALGGVEFDPIGPGSTTVSATIPGYISTTGASRAVTIQAPGITINGGTVGAGLMVQVTGALASATHPADSITLTSSQPSVLLLAPNATTLPTASIRIAIASGVQGFSFVLVGVEGQTGSAVVTGQFNGFTDGTTTGDVRVAGIDISGLGTSLTATDADDPFTVRTGWVQTGNASLGAAQAIRFGGTPLTVTLTSSNAAVGAVKNSSTSGASVTTTIPVGLSTSPATVAAGGASFDPLTAGSTTVAAAGSGYLTVGAGSLAVTVTTPVITIQATTVGGGLQSGQFAGSLSGPVPAGGLTLTLTSANPSLVLVSPNATTEGTGQITIPIAAGATSFNYVMSAPFGVTGTANITASMPGFTGDTRLVTVVQPAFEISGLGTGVTVAAANDEFAFRLGVPNTLNTSLTNIQSVRWGGTELVVTVTNSNATAGQLVTTAGAAQNRTIPVFVGANTTPTTVAAGGVSFDGLAPGTTTVTATIPGFIVLPTSSQSVTVSP